MNIVTLVQSAILSFLPISELRGGIPLAYYTGNPLFLVFLVCTLSNIAVIPFAYFFLDTLNDFFLRFAFYRRVFYLKLESARRHVSDSMKKYGYFGLIIFVAIPLPLTGAYTGTLGAWALGLDRKKSYLSIAIGVILAGVIISLIVYTGSALTSLFVKA